MNRDKERDETGENLELEITDEVRRMLQRTDLGEIRLDREGHWFHRGEPFLNDKLISLFNRSIRPLQGGGYAVVIGKDVYPVTVDDTAYFVRSIDVTRTPPRIELSDGTQEQLLVDSLVYDERGGLYCMVKQGRYRAKFSRTLWHSMMEHMVESGDGIYLQLGEARVRLGDAEADES